MHNNIKPNTILNKVYFITYTSKLNKTARELHQLNHLMLIKLETVYIKFCANKHSFKLHACQIKYVHHSCNMHTYITLTTSCLNISIT